MPGDGAGETGHGRSTSDVREMHWDPVSRVVGSLGVYTSIDFTNRKVVECHSTSSIFRGYSVFLRGKDPRDSHFITSRICGICGDNHAVCSIYAQNMAYRVTPPPWRTIFSTRRWRAFAAETGPSLRSSKFRTKR